MSRATTPTFDLDDDGVRVSAVRAGDRRVAVGDRTFDVERLDAHRVRVTEGDARWFVDVAPDGRTVWATVGGCTYAFAIAPAGLPGAAARSEDALVAPMPATVTRVLVAPGEGVTRGQVLLVLEAMKMELPIKAPHDGTVASIHCAPGDLVPPDHVLATLDTLPSG